ncbi:MAG: multidrug effflux MFS transporter [Hyphomicrobiales bacterium]|nr:multidrug effflux MFS transporter [Hyphomicrobiales bacterium]MCP5370124.1 multidrug effflux MFS transporter [Hyphomicrobiales bacterium]
MLKPNSFAALALLTAVVAFQPLSTDMYLPALPEMARHFATDAGGMQLTLSVFIAGFACAQLVYGPLSDRFGRRPVLIAGAAVFLLASLACALAQTIEGLVLARFAQAVGACAGPVLSRAVVRDVFDRAMAARAMAYIGSATALAPLVAPVLGGHMTVWWGWPSIFHALAVLAALLLAGVVLLLPETNAHRDPHALNPGRLAANYLALFRSREYLGFLVTTAVAFAGLFTFISGSSFVLIDFLGVATDRFGYFFAMVVAGFMSGAFLAGRITLRLGIERMVLLGGACVMAGGGTQAALAWAGVNHPAAVMAPMMAYTCGIGLLVPNATAGAVSVFPRQAGVASAMVGFVQMATAALASLLLGQFHDGTQIPMTNMIGLCGTGGFLCAYLLVWRRGGPS